jgi:hypothetical protein
MSGNKHTVRLVDANGRHMELPADWYGIDPAYDAGLLKAAKARGVGVQRLWIEDREGNVVRELAVT